MRIWCVICVTNSKRWRRRRRRRWPQASAYYNGVKLPVGVSGRHSNPYTNAASGCRYAGCYHYRPDCAASDMVGRLLRIAVYHAGASNVKRTTGGACVAELRERRWSHVNLCDMPCQICFCGPETTNTRKLANANRSGVSVCVTNFCPGRGVWSGPTR